MDKTKVDTAFAASAALLTAVEGANAQTLLISLGRAGQRDAEEFDGFLDHLRDPIDRKQDTQKFRNYASQTGRGLDLFSRKKFRRDVDPANARSSYKQGGRCGLRGSEEIRRCALWFW